MAFDWQKTLTPPEGTPNPRLGVRYDRSGRFLPEAGNTVVAQVVPGSATEAALIDLRRALKSLPHADHFAFTPIASYHMTVFEGVIETRRVPGHWPASVPLDASIDTATAAMTAMLRDLPPLPPFAVRPVAVTPFGVTLTGASDADTATLRLWRDRLSDALGYRTPQHDSYAFHTTLAYCHSWLPVEAVPVYESALAELTEQLQARLPALHLARPNFCRFADMTAFPPVLAL